MSDEYVQIYLETLDLRRNLFEFIREKITDEVKALIDPCILPDVTCFPDFCGSEEKANKFKQLVNAANLQDAEALKELCYQVSQI